MVRPYTPQLGYAVPCDYHRSIPTPERYDSTLRTYRMGYSGVPGVVESCSDSYSPFDAPNRPKERTKTDTNELKATEALGPYFVTVLIGCTITAVPARSEVTESTYENDIRCNCTLFSMRIICFRRMLRRCSPGFWVWYLPWPRSKT